MAGFEKLRPQSRPACNWGSCAVIPRRSAHGRAVGMQTLIIGHATPSEVSRRVCASARTNSSIKILRGSGTPVPGRESLLLEPLKNAPNSGTPHRGGWAEEPAGPRRYRDRAKEQRLPSGVAPAVNRLPIALLLYGAARRS